MRARVGLFPAGPGPGQARPSRVRSRARSLLGARDSDVLSSLSLAARFAWTLAVIGCQSPEPPAMPPPGPPPPAATDCFPPFTVFAHDWFLLADLDLGTSCRVFLEQDECVLGIFDDCTDPSADSRQWVGQIDSKSQKDLLQFHIFEGSGAVLGRPPKCCSGELIDDDWARLDCKLTACDNASDRVHVGMMLERAATEDPFASSTGREVIDETRELRDFALLPGRNELLAIAADAVFLRAIGGTTISIGSVRDARKLAVAPDERTAYVADGTKLLRIDVAGRQVAETVELGAEIELLEHTARGIVVGRTAGTGMMLSLRPHDRIDTVTAERMLSAAVPAIVEIPNGSDARAFLAVVNRELQVLTSTLAASSGAPRVDKPPRELFTVTPQVIGFLAECSERSTEKHCWFELELASSTVRRTGIPDLGDIEDAIYDPARDRMIFSGPDGLGVLDRAEWRPLVQRRVPIEGTGPLALSGANLYALSPSGGFAERLALR